MIMYMNTSSTKAPARRMKLGPNVMTHTTTVHATRGMTRRYGQLFPQPICGAGASVSHFFMKVDAPVTCSRCLAKLAKEHQS